MPCILKQPSENSPGVITFSHGEALWGLPYRSSNVRDFLLESKQSGKWLFGIHVQGDCSHLESWPMPPWQSFVMWPDSGAPFLHNLPASQFCPLTCINFMPTFLAEREATVKDWDVCVISRASTIKRIEETLQLLRGVLDLRPETKIVMIVPDPRHQELGQKTYKKQRIEENYFKLPQKLFSARELKQISFISSSQDSFGNFPLADELVAEILGKSRFMLLNSHLEGVPRVIAEALMLGTPCVVSSRLRSGLNGWLDDKNSIRLTDEPLIGAQQLVAGLENYDRFLVDRESVGAAFSEAKNLHRLKTYLSKLIQAKGQSVNGQWFLEDLHLRLACHGQKQHFQFFNNEKLFFEWIARASALQTAYADEDFLSGDGTIRDDPSVFQRAKQYTSTIVRRLVKP